MKARVDTVCPNLESMKQLTTQRQPVSEVHKQFSLECETGTTGSDEKLSMPKVEVGPVRKVSAKKGNATGAPEQRLHI